MHSTLSTLLRPQRLTEVVDIGASPTENVAPYRSMLDIGICRVTGFEPNEEAFSELIKTKGPNERICRTWRLLALVSSSYAAQISAIEE